MTGVNHILIKVDDPNSSFGDFKIDIHFNESLTSAVSGTIMSDMVYEPMDMDEWVMYPEVKIGDKVYFRHIENLSHEDLILIPYSSLIAKIEPLYPLNGYVIYEVEEINGKFDATQGVVVADGGCKKSYRNYDFTDKPVPVGSKIFIAHSHGVPVEHFLFTHKRLMYVHKKDIGCILN